MDALRTDSEPTIGNRMRDWVAHARSSEGVFRLATIGCAVLVVAMLLFTITVVGRDSEPGTLVSPPFIALLLVANLIPAIALMVLLARNLAKTRAEARGMGSGRLHTRLVALFSVIAAVPTVVVAIFASILIQSGLQFWFSDRSRGMLENTVALAQSVYDVENERVQNNAIAARQDIAGYLREYAIDDPRFIDAFGRYQVYYRNLSEAIIFTVGSDGQIRTLALVNPYDRNLEKVITQAKIGELGQRATVAVNSSDRIGAMTKLDYGPSTYLYVSRVLDPRLNDQITRGQKILGDYRELLSRSRDSQVRFNLALLFGSLVIVALAIFTALKLADRLLKPVGELVDAAGRIESGDLTARVPYSPPTDEIATLGTAFNRMTGRLQEQTTALMDANAQLDTRRAFMEAVLSSVTAGVIALDTEQDVLLINRSAETLLHKQSEELEGRSLESVSPELSEFMRGEAREATVTLAAAGATRTLAVKRMRYADGGVLTFDDITEQLSDQRRAAWSDIARRIAHEIKNPLTPIQLAAERLQRRYGGEISSDPDTFSRLTETIVRQVGDLRRMVDEFSNFARMPKPVFQRENLHEIARASLFLHEVAHPGITFSIDPAIGPIPMVCDRRQIAQALTNLVKNSVEAIEARRNRGEAAADGDLVDLHIRRDEDQLVIDLFDNGVGLPEDRERITEPYMTTRVRGTGLGLAIVKKIVEEHLGEIAFLDRKGGGTHIRIAFDADRLEALEHEETERGNDGAAGGEQSSSDGQIEDASD
jgi:two-component system nitrogen regulation sensor histidine kinase NtrY